MPHDATSSALLVNTLCRKFVCSMYGQPPDKHSHIDAFGVLLQRVTELALVPHDVTSSALLVEALRHVAGMPRLRRLVLDNNSGWTAR